MTLSQIGITVALSFAMPRATELSAPKQVDLAFSFSRAAYEQSQTFFLSDGYRSSPRLDDGRLLIELPAENVAPTIDANKAKGLTLAFGFSRDCLSQMPVRRRMDEDKLLADLAARTQLIDAELTHCEEPTHTPPMAGVIKCESTPGATVVVPGEPDFEDLSADDPSNGIERSFTWRRYKSPAELKARSEKMESQVFASDAPQRVLVCSKPTIVEEQIEDGFPGLGHGLPQRFRFNASPGSAVNRLLINPQRWPGVKDTSPLDVFDVSLRQVAASPSEVSSDETTIESSLIEESISTRFPTSKPDSERTIDGDRPRSALLTAEDAVGGMAERPMKRDYAERVGIVMRFADEGAAHPIYK